MKARHYPQALFAEYLTYDETSSTLLRWIKKPSACIRVGTEAGNRGTDGYWRLQLKRKQWKLHRVLYVLLNGEISDELSVDHLDRNKNNNHPSNLKPKTCSENNLNKAKKPARYARKRGNRWESYFTMPVTHKYVHVGTFDTQEEAHLAAAARRLELYWVL
jgi:hypothetical protein